MSQGDSRIVKDYRISRHQNEKDNEEVFPNRALRLSIITWMKLYANLETPASRAKMRDISIGLAQYFRKRNIPVSDHGTFGPKFAASAPYHYFLTTVDDLPLTYNQSFSVAFHEMIDHTVGELVDSLHMNFMLDVLWITSEYMIAAQNPKMTILYGWLDPHNPYEIPYLPFDIDLIQAKMPSEFGCHHPKISILKFKGDKIRIIISTANIYATDWQTRSQGLWISPYLPCLPANAKDTDGESLTQFKKDFVKFLSMYEQPEILGWESLIRRTDCSAVNVFFIASVPGYHEGSELESWGHRRLAAILKRHVNLPSSSKKWPVIAQSSAVGVFGKNYHSWLLPNIIDSMSQEKQKKFIARPDFKFIYPTQDNYAASYDNKIGQTCLMYPEELHSKQKWVKKHLCQWKSDKTNRSLTMPHMKTYTRISPDQTRIPWFVLTSANLSKGAWGKLINGGKVQYISNYEAGVVFIPNCIINQTSFPIRGSKPSGVPIFLLPYDLPILPYQEDDEPFVITSSDVIPDSEVTEALSEAQKDSELINENV